MAEFVREIKLLSTCRCANVVLFVGFCFEVRPAGRPPLVAVPAGLGLYYRSPTLYRSHEHIWCFYF